MIPSDAHVGQSVIFNPGHETGEEEGVIKRIGIEYAFVLYRGDKVAKATPWRGLRPTNQFSNEEMKGGDDESR